jgi:hypothetical protein
MNNVKHKHYYGNVSLIKENNQFYGTGGVSQGNHQIGFVPGFLDTETGAIYRSCFSDGNPAPMHVLEGLPPSVVVHRSPPGCADAFKASIISGFIYHGRFYTREEAAIAVKAQSFKLTT